MVNISQTDIRTRTFEINFSRGFRSIPIQLVESTITEKGAGGRADVVKVSVKISHEDEEVEFDLTAIKKLRDALIAFYPLDKERSNE